MSLAPALKAISQTGFLIHYYLLLAIVLLKNVCYKIFEHSKSKRDDFSCHPTNVVHPDVFVHSRNHKFNDSDDIIKH